MNNIENTNPNSEASQESAPLNILVVGASHGTGRAVVEKLLNDGHRVTAFSRSASSLSSISDQLQTIDGDATKLDDVENAVENQDAVVVTLGINENPIRVRLFGSAHTTGDVRSQGTKNVIKAMHKHGVKRLVVQSTYGMGETRGLLRFVDQLFFSLVLKPQIDDTEVQEALVKNSGLDWTLVRPVHLSDENSDVLPFVSEKGEIRKTTVPRRAVAGIHSRATHEPSFIGKSIAISG